jgi:hypothetical protein
VKLATSARRWLATMMVLALAGLALATRAALSSTRFPRHHEDLTCRRESPPQMRGGDVRSHSHPRITDFRHPRLRRPQQGLAKKVPVHAGPVLPAPAGAIHEARVEQGRAVRCRVRRPRDSVLAEEPAGCRLAARPAGLEPRNLYADAGGQALASAGFLSSTPIPFPFTGLAADGRSPRARARSGELHSHDPRRSGAPVIDGKLDDLVWQEGNLLTDFVQLEPNQGQPATQRTEARIGYDAENLYFGIRCYDTEPEKVLTGGMRPDTDLVNDDSVAIVLDTFHDGRNGFQFAVNPVGAKSDALIRNEGEEINAYWDGLWQAASARDAQGWTAEIAIPFKTLRFSSGFPQSWGFNIRRLVARGPELSFWKPMRRNWGFKSVYRVSQYGEIRGLAGIAAGARYQLTPYSLLRDERPFRAERDDQGRLGGDLKVNLSSHLVADLTVRTDFAEVEADQQQFNLDRFKLFHDNFRANFLIDWIYRPGSHFFLVYNDVEDLDLVRRDSGLSSLSPGRSIIAKLSRRVDF